MTDNLSAGGGSTAAGPRAPESGAPTDWDITITLARRDTDGDRVERAVTATVPAVDEHTARYAAVRIARALVPATGGYWRLGDDEEGPRVEPHTRPIVTVLCGSTRFSHTFREQNLRLTLAGHIVLSIGCDMHTDAHLFAGLADDRIEAIKADLDELHKRKIDLADEVLILNVGGYIGTSTRSELEYAQRLGKPVRYLEPEPAADMTTMLRESFGDGRQLLAALASGPDERSDHDCGDPDCHDCGTSE